jgi:hypothetical protein
LLQIISGVENKGIASSEPFEPGSADWKPVTVEFTVPANFDAVLIRTGRVSCGEECPISGDDLVRRFSIDEAMTWANKLAFFLIAVIVVFTTLAYGAVHQPVLAVFYLLVAFTVLLWAADAFFSGAVRMSKDLLPFALLAAAVYGFIQIIPFGTIGRGRRY